MNYSENEEERWYGEEEEEEEDYDDSWYRNQIDVAFSLLQRDGFIARAAFMCCSNCAGSAMANEVEEMTPEARAKVRGVIYYHVQDAASAGRGALYIRFGPLDTNEFGKVGLPTEEVGAAAKAALLQAGLTVKWDGSAASCIRVVR